MPRGHVADGPSHSGRVLLLERDLDTAEMYAAGLKVDGFVTTVAVTASEAVACISRSRPDLVVVDTSAASGDEWDVVRECRGRARQPVPVVVITGHAGAAIPRIAAELGCAAILLKPCLPHKLGEVIADILDSGMALRRRPST